MPYPALSSWLDARVTPPTHRIAISLVLVSIASVQVGAAIAKGLFDVVSPTGMVWLRLAASALILTLLVRPNLAGRTPRDWRLMLAYAVCLGGMNWAVYQAFHRIPLGLTVTIEFLGPLTVAVVTSRVRRDVGWALLAACGVAMLGFSPTDVSWVGVGYALLAGAGWAGYIVISPALGARWSGLSGLAMASVVASLVLLGPAVVSDGRTLLDPHVLLIGLAVGLMSSVIPYSLELRALRTLPRRVFSILMSLEPAAAALAALLILGEQLSLVDVLAMGCVVAASVGITRGAAPPPVAEEQP